MKILFLVHEFPPIGGGVGRTTYKLVEEYLNKGHEPIVLTCKYKQYDIDDFNGKLKVYTVWGKRKNETENNILLTFISFVVLGFFRAFSILKKEKIDIIHAQLSIPAGLLAWLLKIFTHKKYIVSLLGSDVPYHIKSKLIIRLRFLIKQTWKNSNQCVALSNGTRTTACRTFKDASTFPVIPSGVDKQYKIDNKFNKKSTKDHFKIVSLGRLLPLKGIQDVIKAIALINKDKGDLKISYDIIGNGPMFEELNGLVAKNNLQSVINFHGFIDQKEIIKIFNQSDVFIGPSYAEALGMVFIEALACGLPLIGSNVGGIPDIIDEKVGLMVEPGNIKQIANAIISIRDNYDHYSVEDLLDRASKFSWDSISDKYLDLYQTIIAN